MTETSQPGNNGPGQIISSVRSIRLAIFLITTSLIGACSVFNVIVFTEPLDEPQLVDIFFDDNNTSINVTNSILLPPQSTSTTKTELSEIPPVYLFLCGLSLSAISAFLRAGFILKLCMMIVTVIVQTAVLYNSILFDQYEATSNSL